MRQSLLVARQDLHSLDERAMEEQKLTEEMTRLREQKEHQKATDTMQLKTILVELDEEKSKTRKLESENSDLGDKLKELKSRLEALTTQNQDLEIGDTFMKNEIKMLKTLNDERSIEIQQLQEMVNELQSRTKDKLNESSINMSFGMPENLGDILATDFQSKVNELEEITEQLKNHNAKLVKQAEESTRAIQSLEEQIKGKEAMENQVQELENKNAELAEQMESLKATANSFQSELHMRENSLYNLNHEHEQEIEELKVANEQSVKKMEAKHAEQKAQMKEKLQSRLKEAGNIMQTKYNEKLEQYAAEKDQEVSEIRSSESKFSKMAEELQKKYNASKAIVTDKMVENKKLKAEVEELRKKLCRQEQPKKQTSMAPPPPSNVFKAPTKAPPKNTPGRSKPGRTQSDIQIKAPARRPPMGTGNLFTMDDEQGEMFSNSYLSELKSGKCSMDSSGKAF